MTALRTFQIDRAKPLAHAITCLLGTSRIRTWLGQIGRDLRNRQECHRAVGNLSRTLLECRARLPIGRPLVGVLLAEHFGDIVACEPILPWLREQHPDGHLVWLTKPHYAELVRYHPSLDEVIEIGSIAEIGPGTIPRFFDRVVDLHLHLKPCSRYGWAHKKTVGNTAILAENYYSHGNLLEALSLSAGLPKLGGQPRLYLPQSVARRVDRLALPARFVAVHTRSNEDARNWTDAAWNEFVDRVIREHGLPVVEIGLQPTLNAGMCGVMDLCGKLTLLETAEVVRRADCYVGVDSGPAHFANAFLKPAVILLGAYRMFPRYLPYSGFLQEHASRMVIQWDGPCAQIPVSEVLRRFVGLCGPVGMADR